jgi:type VII secretion-associated serine protease mycosin
VLTAALTCLLLAAPLTAAIAATLPAAVAATPAAPRPSTSSSHSRHPVAPPRHGKQRTQEQRTHKQRTAPAKQRASPAKPAPRGSCHIDTPHAHLATTWPQTRLGFQSAWPITEGAGVRVAVVDSGLTADNPQLNGIKLGRGRNVIGRSGTTDCVKHGTEVTAIIAAQQIRSSAFVGVAPKATIIVIKQTDKTNDGSGTPLSLARGIDAAVAARAQVANVSVTISRDDPTLRRAVRRAHRAGMIIVAAVGNEGQHGNAPTWPAAYSTAFDNVIAVSASNRADMVPPFPERGSYVDVAAPGIGYQVPAPGGGFDDVSGTSFAAPYVTGTVALMLAAKRDLTPAAVRRRLELTADSPPTVTVPDRRFGYGIVNSYLAVTAVLGPRRTASSPPPASPIPAPAAPVPPDRHVQHVALATAAVLLVLAALIVVGAAVLRRGGEGRRMRGGPAPRGEAGAG